MLPRIDDPSTVAPEINVFFAGQHGLDATREGAGRRRRGHPRRHRVDGVNDGRLAQDSEWDCRPLARTPR
ncbi:MAG: hypothetical protein ABEH86_04810 [Haloarcula sp.]